MSNTYPPSSARLSDYLVLIRRRWASLMLGILLGAIATALFLALAPRSYTADTFVLVTGTPGDNATAATNRGSINLDTEAQLVTSTATLAQVAKTLHLSGDAVTSLPDNVTVTVPPNTEILDISYVASSPAGAQQGSLAFANAYLAQRTAAAQDFLKGRDKALQAQIDALNAQVKPLLAQGANEPAASEARARTDQQITTLNNRMASLTGQQSQIRATDVEPGRIVVQPAVPTSPSSPNVLVTLAGGIVVSLLLGVGFAAFRERSDDRIHTPQELFKKTRVPVATVLSTRQHPGEVSLVAPMSPDGRGYGRLRNLLTANLQESDRPVVLVAGIRRGVGPVAANVAASLARSGEEVVLVCADVFANTAPALVHGGAHDGLAEFLAGEADLDAVLQQPQGITGLRVIGPGRAADRADTLLQTSTARKLVDRLLENASYVVIEAPPTAESPDAQTLATVAGATVLVVDAGHTTAREVVDACAQLESMHTPLLGAVFAKFGRDRAQPVDAEGPQTVASESALETRTEPAGNEETRDLPVTGDAAVPPAAKNGATGASASSLADTEDDDSRLRGPELVPPHLRGRPRP